MIADGRFARPGVNAPEALADQPGVVDHLLAELKARGVVYRAATLTA
jgi:hypothetical protein